MEWKTEATQVYGNWETFGMV